MPRRVAQNLHELEDTWADDEPRAPAQRQTRYRPRHAAIIEAIKTRARGLTTLETRFETVVGVPLWNVFLNVLRAGAKITSVFRYMGSMV